MKKVCALMLAVLLLLGSNFVGSISSAYSTNNYTWKSVKIGAGGFVTGLVYNPVENGLLFARTDVGGAYRYDSATKAWIPLSDFIGRADAADMGVLSIAVDPTNANKVYMMTGDYVHQWARNGNFYASTDKGATWTKTAALPFKVGGNAIGRNTGERLQVDRNLTNVLYMGSTMDGLYKSTDSGANWSKVTSFPATNINFVILDTSSSSPGTATSRIIVGANGTSNTMYISNNGGSTWSTISGQPSGYCPIRADILSGILYVTFSAFSDKPEDMPGPSSANSGVIYKYSTSTGTWTNITPSGEGTYFGFGGISVDKQNANHIVVTSLDNYWPVGDKVYQSYNGGSTWTEILRSGTRTYDQAPYASDSTINWLADIKIDPFNSNKAIFCHGGGVFMTENLSSSSVTWSYESNGMEETCLFEIKSPPSGTNLFSTMGDVGAFKHDNLAVSPPEGEFTPGTGNNRSIDFAESVPTKLVRSYDSKSSTSYGAYSTDGGKTWTEFASAPSNAGLGGNIGISADGSKIVWTPKDSSYNDLTPYVSTNNGASWTACSGGVAGKKPVADRVNSNKFYQFDYENGKVYVSTNGGASFTVGATGLPTVPNYSSNDADMEAVFGREGHLWAATGAGGLYYSTNSGTSFTKLTNVTAAYKVGFGKAATTGGYPAIFLNGTVEGTYGFFRSDDQGASWVRINDNAHQYGNPVDITGDPKVYGRVYIATGGRGIIYGDLQGTTPSGIQSGHVYELVNRNSGKAMDVNGGSTADGGDVIQWAWSNGNNQKWRIDDLGNGYYTLTNVNSGKLLDVNGGSTADGGNVIQWSSNGGYNQQWQIIDNGSGYYRLINRNSGKALDVNGGSTADGGDVIQWTWSGGNNQQWQLTYLY